MVTAEEIPISIAQIKLEVEELAQQEVAPLAAETDAHALWPERQLKRLADARLMGLHAPRRLGGREQGLQALVVATEALGRACSSTAMCFGMHCVASAVIAAKASPYHEEHFLRPIAEGRHVTTLALSEGGSGSHFYIPESTLRAEGGQIILSGGKHFVTNGGYADSCVGSFANVKSEEGIGEFSCVLFPGSDPGLRWGDEWRGFGMRGNSSRSVWFEDLRVPTQNLLGEGGDQLWYVFEIVTPYFSMAMAGTYLGIAQAALDAALQDVGGRNYTHSGTTLADEPVIQHKLGTMWTELEKTRRLVYHAASMGDAGNPNALVPILSSKAAAAGTAIAVANEAMTILGGRAYRENSLPSRLLRDARAGDVMAPTTDILKTWMGRALLGRPLL
jgi:isovaleryl-CoA dehydrogenase